MMLHTYIPQDRLRALARGNSLPDRTTGTALFTDISGFTPLTEKLTHEFGVRRGIEELTRRINDVYDAMLDQVDRFDGSVVSFAGDAVTSWFDDGLGNSAQRAVDCAQALQDALKRFPDLSIKTAVCTGPVRRFAIGDANIRLLDTLAGATVARLSTAEQLAKPGDVILDSITTQALGISNLPRCLAENGEEFSILDASSEIQFKVQDQPVLPALEPMPQIDPEVLKPWILHMVYERETTGHQLLLTDLRPTTALFIRFTGIDYDNDLQAWEKLNSIVSGTQQILDIHEGALLELTIGDKGSYFYASFGATHIHENDTHRAIRAALEIREKFNGRGFPESIQIGISSGTMRVGGYGGRNRKSFSALGNGVNLAARLMMKAASGEILVSGRVQKAGEDEFAFEARPPMAIKGKSEPILVFAVQGPLQSRAIRLKEPSYTLPLIGRKNEMELIAAKLELAIRGHGQIIGITGEAGMGKSRLAAEGIRLARRRKLPGYGGACQSDGVITPYLVWIPIWNAYFNLDPATPLRKQVRAIEGELEDCCPEHVDALPLLGSVLGLPLPENDFTRSLQPSDRKAQLETVLLKILQFTAKEAGEDGTGVLLVLEDLHWIDPVSLDLLVQISRAIEHLPILIVLTYRPAEVEILHHPLALLQGLDYFTEIKLAELDTSESEQVIRAKLAHLFHEHRGIVPPILIQRITDRAQGNPFYVEELLNYMHDRGIDPHDIDSLKNLELPTSLHSLILSRIDQLASSQQLALKVASIIGRIFRFEHLHRYYPALGSEEHIKSDLKVMEKLDLTPLESPEPDLTYLFKHLITHEVGYESIAYATRMQLHGQYAAFLEAAYPDQIEILTPQLAYHYDRAGIRDKAHHYLLKSGEQAAANFANEETLAYFNRALDFIDEKTGRDRFDILMKRERVYDLLGRRREQRQDLDELFHLTSGFEDSAYLRTQLALRRAKLEFDEGNYSAAKAEAQAAIQEVTTDTQLRDRSPDLLVDALWLEARAMFFAGQAVDAKPQLDNALTLAQTHHYIRGEYNALAQLGLWHWYNGDNETAVKLLEQSLALIRQAGDIRRELDMLINLGIVKKDMYRFADSVLH
ncbi:MAG TPA: adenylate/guanylate cyclase domain-containing protein, partial [Anaerolineales bacterium]|nr:adenylate/guanylate cyclase domain-containing protein [Anaerolineales bacterium]